MFTMKPCVLSIHTAPCVCLSVGVLLLLTSLASAEQDVKYVPLGGVFELHPNGSSGSITQIIWKIGTAKVAEWWQNTAFGTDVDYYGRNCVQLNKATGRLIINNITKEYGGEYSVEVNGYKQTMEYKVEVIKNVTKPSVAFDPQDCSPDSTSCLLVCEGDATDSGVVTYRWKKDEGEWMESEQDRLMNITNNEEWKMVDTFFCEMKNKVSAEQSDPCYNPFKRPVGRAHVGRIVAGVIAPILVVGLVLLGVKVCGKQQQHGDGGECTELPQSFTRGGGVNSHDSSNGTETPSADTHDEVNEGLMKHTSNSVA